MAEPGSTEAEKAARRLVQDVRERHQAIASSFGTDAGARLMRRDSDIAETVMADMLKKGHLALPMHDGFIVKATAAEVLEEAMRKALDTAGLGSIGIQRKGTVEKEGLDSFLINRLGTKRSDIMLPSPLPFLPPLPVQIESPIPPDEAPRERSELRTPPKADDSAESSLTSEPLVLSVEATHLASSTGSISSFDTRHTPDVLFSGQFTLQATAFASELKTSTIFNPDASLTNAEIRLDTSQQPDLFSTTSADPSTSTIAADTHETLQEARTSQDATPADEAIPASTSSETPSKASQAGRVGYRLEQELSLGGKLTIWSEGEDCSREAVHGRPCILRHEDGAGRRTSRKFSSWATAKVAADDIRSDAAFVRTAFNGRYDATQKPAEPKEMGFVERWRAGLIKPDDQFFAPILRMLPGATIREIRFRSER